MDKGCTGAINAQISDDLAILPKGSTTKSTRNLRTSLFIKCSRDTFGGDFNMFGRPLSSSNMCLLSYPPENLPETLDFLNAIDDTNHQNVGNDLVRGVLKI